MPAGGPDRDGRNRRTSSTISPRAAHQDFLKNGTALVATAKIGGEDRRRERARNIRRGSAIESFRNVLEVTSAYLRKRHSYEWHWRDLWSKP